MNENNTKRREWVKTAAIIFLVIMLILTFFSNTIMNRSLPEIAAQYVQSGTINEKIRANGTLASAKEYIVSIDEERVIDAVNVKVGDAVNKDDVLFTLEDSDSTELSEARDTLDKLESAYQKALLSADPEYSSDSINIKNKQSDFNDIKDIDANMKKVEKAEDDLLKANLKMSGYENSVNDINDKISSLSSDDFTSLDKEYYTKLNSIQNSIKNQEKVVEEKKKEYDDVASDMSSGASESQILSLRKEIEALSLSLSNAKEPYEWMQIEIDLKYKNEELEKALNNTPDSYRSQFLAKKSLYDNANTTLNGYKESLNKAKQSVKTALEEKLDKVNFEKKEYQYELTEIEKKYNDLVQKYGATREEAEEKVTAAERELESMLAAYTISSGSSKIDLNDQKKEIEKQKKKVEELSKNAVSGEVKAKVSGVIKTVDVTPGTRTQKQGTLAVIDINSSGYTFEYSLTKQQAKKLTVGQEAEVEYFWNGEASAVVSKIVADPANPNQNSLVTFTVSGDVTAGETINISVGGKSQNYDAVVPKNAVREDNNGKFVYIVNSKNSPLGNRYYIEKTTVQVLASDDRFAAVTGLYGNEFVLTTSNKPVENGTQVRLAN